MRSSKTLWDQLDNRQIIRDMLAPTDYEITETENGEEARGASRSSESYDRKSCANNDWAGSYSSPISVARLATQQFGGHDSTG